MTDKLPPLPTSNYDLCFYDEGGMQEAPGEGYTADQMRAYAQEAARQEREQCVKVCEEFGDDYMQQARGGDNSGASDHKACAAVEIADELRSRSSTTGENGG